MMTPETANKILVLTKRDYERIARDFSDTRKRNWPEIQHLVKKYIRRGDRVLEVGCGNGRLYELLKDQDVFYTGVDQASSFISLASKKYAHQDNHAEFSVANALDLPETLKGFDVVFLIALLNHIPTRKLQTCVLENAFCALKPGGVLIMTNWNMWALRGGEKSVWKFLWKRMSLSPDEYKKRYFFPKSETSWRDVFTLWGDKNNPAHLYYYAFTLRELRRFVKRCGGTVMDNFYIKMGKKSFFFMANNSVLVAKK